MIYIGTIHAVFFENPVLSLKAVIVMKKALSLSVIFLHQKFGIPKKKIFFFILKH